MEREMRTTETTTASDADQSLAAFVEKTCDRLPSTAAAENQGPSNRFLAVTARTLRIALDGAVWIKPGAAVVDACRAAGLLINCTAEKVLRFSPPLIVTRSEVDRAVDGILGRRRLLAQRDQLVADLLREPVTMRLGVIGDHQDARAAGRRDVVGKAAMGVDRADGVAAAVQVEHGAIRVEAGRGDPFGRHATRVDLFALGVRRAA